MKYRFMCLCLVMATLITCELRALNGMLFYGIGARNRAMGGANGAHPVDSSTLLINPAGIGALGNTADFGVHCLYVRASIDRSGAVNSLPNKAAGKENSGQNIYITPFDGITYKRSPESSFAFGAMFCGVAAEGVKYSHPRIDPASLTDDYDTHTTLIVLRSIIGTSYDLNDSFHLGLGLHINSALLSADLATVAPISPFPQTAGDGRLEIAYGAGFSLGIIYDLNEHWSFGAAYVSPQWFEDFGRYADLVPDFKLPPEVRIGSAFRWSGDTTLTADYKWIGWSTISLFNKKPTEGGFLWRDQHSIGLGAEHKFCPTFTGRAGINYAHSPIRKDALFANALVPVVMEVHLAIGAELLLPHSSLAASFVYTPRNKVRDDGSGDAFSVGGKGVEAAIETYDFDVVWSLVF